MELIITIFASVIAGGLYYLGGEEKYNTYYRDAGCPAIMILTLMLWGWWDWTMILCFGLFWAFLTTYWDFVNKWFGKKEEDKYWFNWLLASVGYSLAMLPLVIQYHLWVGFFVRLVILGGLTVLISERSGKVKTEAWGRGFFANVTLPLLWVF